MAFLLPRQSLWCRAMTSPPLTTSATALALERATWRTEIAETAKLALPIALTQLGQIAMMTTDLALIGRLGDGAVAAVSLAHLILFSGFVLGMGPISAVAPLAAQAFGARNPRMVRRALRVGLWAAILLGVPDQHRAALGRRHLDRGRSGAGDRRARRALSLRARLVDDPCLVLHRDPQFHGRGQSAGAGTMGDARRDPDQRHAGLCADPRRCSACRDSTCSAPVSQPRWSTLACARPPSGSATPSAVPEVSRARTLLAAGLEIVGQLFVIGAPISGSMLLEWGLFSSAALLVGWIGTTELAAHQIALQVVTDHFHGAVRHLARGDRAGRTRGRPPRCGGDTARGLQRARTGRCLHHGGNGDRRGVSRRHPAGVPRQRYGRDTPRRRRSPARCC